MNAVKSYLIIALASACLVVAGIAIGFIDSPAAPIIAAGANVVALVAFGYITQNLCKTAKAATTIADSINSGDIDSIKCDNSAFAPLVKAISRYHETTLQDSKPTETSSAQHDLELQFLQKQNQNTEAIIHTITDAVIATDDFDRVIMTNQAAQELFDFQIQPDQNTPISELINDADFAAMIQKSRKSKLKHVRHELTFQNDSEQRVFDCIISCVNDQAGNVCGVVAILHDISKEKEMSKTKNDFVSHVSHELKTPLASINAYAEMLVDGEATDEQTIGEFCSIIQSQAQRLNRLIEEILNISRIESGLIKVVKEPASMAILIQDASTMIDSYAKEKDITLNVPAPIIHDQVQVDKDMLSQVIINLLSNAVKYTENGGEVTVDAQVHESERIVRVTVTDTGVGIPPEDVEHVFDKFYRVEANKKYAKGTGLGLNLVQQIVEKVHGGNVFVTSTVGQGSTFGFEMPLLSAQTAAVS